MNMILFCGSKLFDFLGCFELWTGEWNIRWWGFLIIYRHIMCLFWSVVQFDSADYSVNTTVCRALGWWDAWSRYTWAGDWRVACSLLFRSCWSGSRIRFSRNVHLIAWIFHGLIWGIVVTVESDNIGIHWLSIYGMRCSDCIVRRDSLNCRSGIRRDSVRSRLRVLRDSRDMSVIDINKLVAEEELIPSLDLWSVWVCGSHNISNSLSWVSLKNGGLMPLLNYDTYMAGLA